MEATSCLQTIPEHVTIEPSVLYVGTPVVLITTMNEDGTPNISPMSSAWALSDRVVLGLAASGQGAKNLQRERECVLNFPSPELWANVEKIARATGSDPVPMHKAAAGYEYVADKFALGGFTPIASDTVRPPRVAECPIQFEARLVCVHGDTSAAQPTVHLIAEAQVLRVHAHRSIVVPGTHHIDTARWSPLLYVFRHYFGTGEHLGKTFKAER
jgi:flavin reductase (DIM6/NTAB) family NADH-FMN oxidoreductase RutF